MGAAIRSILLDRACGYLVLVVLYALGLLIWLRSLADPKERSTVVVALGSFGVPVEAALAISVLVGLYSMVVGLPGGLMWLADWDIGPSPRPKRPTPSGFD